jgi:hypothetical protein
MLDGLDAVALKERGEGALHDAAVGEHVTDAGGNAQIVLEDDELAVVEAQQIGADHGDVDIARHLQAAHLAAVMAAAIDQLAGNDVVIEDPGVRIDVAQEKVERGDALGEAALDPVPLGGGDQARQKIVREDALGAFVAAVDGEGDALGEEREVGRLLAALQLFSGQAGEGFRQGAIVGADFTAAFAHLVEGPVERVIAEECVQFHCRACAHGVPYRGFRTGEETAIPGAHAPRRVPARFMRRLRLYPVLLFLTWSG